MFAAHLESRLDLKLCYSLHSSFELRIFSMDQTEFAACTLCSLHRCLLERLRSLCRGEIIILNIRVRTEMLNSLVCPCGRNGSFIKSC